MLLYTAKRLGLSVIICFVSALLLFIAVRLVPGDPVTLMLGNRATPEMRAHLTELMGLNEPLYMQFMRFIGRLMMGDLGTDLWSRRPVLDIVMDALPSTMLLCLCSLGMAAAIGIPLGCFAAIHRDSLLDKITAVISVSAISVPTFVVAVYLVLLFSIRLHWFPIIGAGESGDAGDQFMHLVLPSFAIGLGWIGYLARIVRGSMLEILHENHVRTARAFGLSELTIIRHYALRLAVIPTITMLGLSVGSVLSSAIFVENIFARPGIGKLIVDAAYVRNYAVVQGGVLATVALFVVATPLADLAIAWLDPRIRKNL